MKNKYYMIITTSDNKDVLLNIAKLLVEKSLAACVQIIDKVESVYKWQEKVVNSKEYIAFIKTSSDNYKEVEDFILKIHNYELPEIIALNIADGYDKYFKWIDENTN